jgi:hypothetical protein
MNNNFSSANVVRTNVLSSVGGLWRNEIMHIVPGFVVRQIAGETVAIPAGAAARALSGLLALNGSGRLLFERLQTEQTEESLVQFLLEQYEIDEATAKADVAEFLETLRHSGVLIES